MKERWIQKMKEMMTTKNFCMGARLFSNVKLICCFFLLMGGFQIHRNNKMAVILIAAAAVGLTVSELFFRLILDPFLYKGGKCVDMLLALPAFRGLGERWDRDRSALGNLLYGIGEQHLEELLQEMQKMLEESFDKERNLKLFRVQAQINALQSQINPHFLYNALEVMRSYAYTAGANQVAEMAEALSTMFRYSVGKADDVCTVEEEMDSINNYFLIQHYRYNDRFSLKLLYDPKEDELMKCQIPRLSVQPIIENAVHHGLERKLGKGTVSIRIFAAWDRLIIRVLDDGVGIPADQVTELNRVFSLGLAYKAPAPEARKEESTHIALININQRIKLYFGEEYGLSISSALGAGTLVELNLPRKYQPLSRETGTDEADYFTGFPTIQTTSSNHDSGSALL